MTQIPKIRLENITKSFGSNHVLNGIDLDVPTGKSLVVIGGSGSGKSVMLKCILGLLHADGGRIYIDGQDMSGFSRAKKREFLASVGMLFQSAALFDSLSVWENVAFGLIQGQRMARKQAKEVAIEKLAKVGLAAEVGELGPAELSGGMQKRVGLARAIATEPEIIFFDEPTTGLDPIMADVINGLIAGLVKDMGVTAISITHDMASARKIADRVSMIFKGKIIWTGDVGEIDNSGNDYVDQFINGRAEGPIRMEVLKG